MDFHKKCSKLVIVMISSVALNSISIEAYSRPVIISNDLFITGTIGYSKLADYTANNYNLGCPCFYNYKISNNSSNSVGGGALGSEIKFKNAYLYALDIGVSFNKPGTYKQKGDLSQGADEASASYYQYSYAIKTQQVLVESKLLFQEISHVLPYINFGLGMAFNKANSYQNNVSPFFEFTPQFANHNQNKLAYVVGGGIDYRLGISGWRIGAGYRYNYSGTANLGQGILDETVTPFTIKQRLDTNQVVIQVTYIV